MIDEWHGWLILERVSACQYGNIGWGESCETLQMFHNGYMFNPLNYVITFI